ncbi:beta and beta-prime subunits of DNA dependent RNA-polymerase [Neoconidiobolus thromboides FSU 785]|nr:beta and beta-prime subunits of DNA dependent RNA-polymerase [Neoconidiobolus thromboides FSU 785]
MYKLKKLNDKSLNNNSHHLGMGIASYKVKGKEGIYRNYCPSNRVSYCGRAVIPPGIEHDKTYIGLPKSFKEVLKLKDKDYVIANPRPISTRGSILDLKVYFHKNKTIELHPKLCKIFNADFDGDEMNIFVTKIKQYIDEVRTLMAPTTGQS